MLHALHSATPGHVLTVVLTIVVLGAVVRALWERPDEPERWEITTTRTWWEE